MSFSLAVLSQLEREEGSSGIKDTKITLYTSKVILGGKNALANTLATILLSITLVYIPSRCLHSDFSLHDPNAQTQNHLLKPNSQLISLPTELILLIKTTTKKTKKHIDLL